MSKIAASWDAAQYLLHNDLRSRPAVDLLQRAMSVMKSKPAVTTPVSQVQIVDLGCGPGNSTRIIASAFPSATITGIDSANDMLDKANRDTSASEYPNIRFQNQDLTHWVPREQQDLIFSNALYQWVANHDQLFPALAAALKPQTGVLAIQMPRNFQAPSHVLLRKLAGDASEPWEPLLRGRLPENPVADPVDYYAMLAGLCAKVDIWETEYLQVLKGENPVLEWVKGTALVPVRAALQQDPDLFARFEAKYASALRDAYPVRPDGTTLFPFRRIFIVALAK
eukprot:ANDGO_05779.mRNA.1 Trans-aconitate 2-methyltransferase